MSSPQTRTDTVRERNFVGSNMEVRYWTFFIVGCRLMAPAL